METIINGLLNIDPSVYALILGGAAGVSLLTQWTKKIFALTNEKHIVAILNLIALLASGFQYFLSASDLPPTILGISTVVLTGVATPLYIYVIKPLSIFINNVNLYKNRVLEKVEQVEAVVAPVVITETIPTQESITQPVVTVEEAKEEVLPVADF